MRLTAEGCRQVLASMRESRAMVAQRRSDAVRRMGEAEAEVHQLGRILTATDTVIEAWEGQLSEVEPTGAPATSARASHGEAQASSVARMAREEQ